MIKDFYRARLKEGYKMHEIDKMDIAFYFELLEQDEVYITADDLDWL